MPLAKPPVAMSNVEMQTLLVAAFQGSKLFSQEVRIIETHISFVLLTGEFAYKIKKAVDYGFLDFSTLEKRKYYCEQELLLNNNYSTGLYLAVVEIRGSLERPVIEELSISDESAVTKVNGGVLEYAVKMRQFESGFLLSDLARKNELDTPLINKLASKLADAHGSSQAIYTNHIPAIEKACLGNIKALSWPVANDVNEIALVEWLRDWTVAELTKLQETFQARTRAGFVRTCHGDLHLGNITLIKNAPVFFDCIEFNDELRTVDTISELAFLLMDMEYRQQPYAANELLNRYLQLSGDYDGLAVLNFYKVYRALVRAKVYNLQAQQENKLTKKIQHQAEYLKYLYLAKNYTVRRTPKITITYGVSGSGKSTLAKQFAAQTKAIQVSSDIERKRIFGIGETSKSNSNISSGIYSDKANDKTYLILLELARRVIKSGYSIVVDASFLEKKNRNLFFDLAKFSKSPIQILECTATEEELKTRLEQRSKSRDSISEAGLEVLKHQLERRELLTPLEKMHVIQP